MMFDYQFTILQVTPASRVPLRRAFRTDVLSFTRYLTPDAMREVVERLRRGWPRPTFEVQVQILTVQRDTIIEE